MLAAQSSGDINLFEASQLARLTPERLGTSPSQAKRTRSELLSTHLQARLSGERLRQRIAEILRVPSNEAGESPKNSPDLDLEDFDPYDPTHLFYDEIKRLGFALQDIRPEDLTDDLLEEYLRASEPLWAVLAEIQRRKKQCILRF